MSLNRYHNSRGEDNVFKLLHEETSYLDILKGNVKAAYKDEIEEEADGIHQDVRQQLLQEEGGIGDIEAADTTDPKDEGTPEQQEKAVKDEAAPEGAKQDKEMGVKEQEEKKEDDDDEDEDEDEDEGEEEEVDEISIAVARQAAKRTALQSAKARKGLLRAKSLEGMKPSKPKGSFLGR